MKVSKIAVGSTNPVKIGAVKDGLKKLYPEAHYVGVKVESGVSHQPTSDEETMKGAKNRARKVLAETQADIAVGLEGGVIEVGKEMMNTVWCCLVTKKEVEILTGGLHFETPKVVAEGIRSGREVGDIMDEMTGEKDIKRKGGMIGVLSKGVIDRREAYASLVKLATVKLQSPELYND